MVTTAKTLDEITKDEFMRYEAVRRSGATNMFFPLARALAGISPEAHIGIIKYYAELMAKWPDVRKSR